jgi:hypothetical protein
MNLGTLREGASSCEPKTPYSSIMCSSQIIGLQPGEVFWPEAILPSVLPETRIFTWGYDADVDAFNTSVGHNNVEQHANDLLIDIANLLEKLGDVSDCYQMVDYRTDWLFIDGKANHLCCT